MVSHHAAQSGDCRHCGSGDMMFLVVEGQESTCPASTRHYCLSLKDMTLKLTAYLNNNSDSVYTRLKQKLEKNLKISFASLSKKSYEKEKDETRSW